jgi:thiamine-phosphate pyrophosphorylase
MHSRQTLPCLWLVTDRRNDSVLEKAIARLPRGSGVIFRHYHLEGPERRDRFRALARLARQRGHVIVLSDDFRTARRWGADGVYGVARQRRGGGGLLRLATAHSLKEMGAARRIGADAILLSPVFPTRSHPAQNALGPVRFRLIACLARMPVIALGGMNRSAARRLLWPRWAAIDGLAGLTE